MTGLKVKTKYFNVISLDFFFNLLNSRENRISSNAMALRFLFPACPFHGSCGDAPIRVGGDNMCRPGLSPRRSSCGVASGSSLRGKEERSHIGKCR